MPFTIRVKRRSMWSSAMNESGRMIRSTDECEMSRSCQSATFSSAAAALPRSSRARPQICSQPIGLRLWGIADEPFCPLANGSSTSPISVFCRPRISSANFSSDAAQMASVVTSSAWRSRWMTCDDTAAGSSPSRAHTSASIDGGRWAKVPTAPEIFPTRTISRARSTRTMSRRISAYQSASFRPNVIGSACTPCVRPIIGVRRCSSARTRTASARRLEIRQDRSHASRIWSASAVSTTSDEVRPKCSQRADGPTFSATAVVNAMTSWWVVASISSMRAMSNAPLARMSRAASAGTSPAAAIESAAAVSTASQLS